MPQVSDQLPPIDEATTSILPQPESVLARHVIQKGKYHPWTEILVKWKGAVAEDATWENAWRFQKSHPDILEDKDS